MRLVFAVIACFGLGCDGPVASDAGTDPGARPPSVVGPDERPARLFAPVAHDGRTELPLVVVLHGYGANAMLQDAYLGMTRAARTGGFYVLLPDGTVDAGGSTYWDVTGLAVDDFGYLRALIEETASIVPVAPGEIYVVGHSNGGFMAYRLACDAADLVAGIASLAGGDALPECEPSQPVSVLQIHGTVDSTVPYDGGSVLGLDYAAAPVTVERWAARAGCDATPEELEPLDLVSTLDGAETRVSAYRSGCEGAAAELWSMEGAEHIPALTSAFAPSVVGWLRAHAR